MRPIEREASGAKAAMIPLAPALSLVAFRSTGERVRWQQAPFEPCVPETQAEITKTIAAAGAGGSRNPLQRFPASNPVPSNCGEKSNP